MYASGMDGPPHGPRMGTAEASGDMCNVSLDRFFFVRGMETSYLPADFESDASLPSNSSYPWLGAPPIPALPASANVVDNTYFPPGATSTDTGADGGVRYPGAAFAITGTFQIPVVRHSAQRDYKGYAAGPPAAPSALSFSVYGVVGSYSLQENVLSMTGCGTKYAFICELAATVAPPSAEMAPWVTFSFIGTDLTSTRTRSVVVAKPHTGNYTADLATCANVKLILPHDGSIHDGTPTGDASTP
jgi:hypothetical protein